MDWLSQIGQWFVSAWNWIADSVYKSIVADNRYVFYLTGLGNTLLISLMAVVIGITLGVLIAVVVNAAKANPRLNWAKKICSLYVTVIRGTPVVLQLMIIYYIIFRSVQIPQIVVGGLAFGLNSAAYISEDHPQWNRVYRPGTNGGRPLSWFKQGKGDASDYSASGGQKYFACPGQ